MDESSTMHFTDRLGSVGFEYDCLVLFVVTGMSPEAYSLQFYAQWLPFWIRPHDIEKTRFLQQLAYSPREKFSFEKLYTQNITSNQLFIWSAPIDIIERYQIYVDTLDQSTSYSTYLNCTPPWFGSLCQYKLEQKIQTSTLISVNGSCYIHLNCDRGPPPLCLQWFDICDGKVDCANHGIDELYCDQLEMNECDPNEFCCRDGTQCIRLDLLSSSRFTANCQDGSDETKDVLRKNSCHSNNFFCDEHKCPIGQLSCGSGECVSDFNECENSRGYFLMYNLLLSNNLSQPCKMAMSCATVGFSSPICNEICPSYEDSCFEIIFTNCSSLFEFLSLRHMPAYTQFLYQNRHSDDVIPEYICYPQHFLSIQSITMSWKNFTCRSLHKFEISNISLIDRAVRELVSQYTMHSLGNMTHCLHPAFYHCQNSIKCISKHRLVDGVRDCAYADDETYENNCSLLENYRLKCSGENKCIMPWMKFDGRQDCLNGSDELRPISFYDYEPWKTEIFFPNLCNRVNEILPSDIDGKNESDETAYEAWPCNHAYTRCDISWSCHDGNDEVNCKSTASCPSFHHPCISPITYEMICLNISKAGDGKIDCLGGSDERHIYRQIKPWEYSYNFLCWNGSKCIRLKDLCDGGNNSYSGSDEFFCNQSNSHRQNILKFFGTITHHEHPRTLIFLFNRLYLFPEIVQKNEPKRNSIPSQVNIINNLKHTDESTLSLLDIYSHRSKCNRGITLTERERYNDSDYYHDVCLCSPNCFGDSCQYQSQRVGVTVKINATNESQTRFTIVILLLNQEYIVNSYDRHEYIAIRDCGVALTSYLLYSNRPKINGHNYSVQIDVYENHHHLNYRASWLFPLSFSFLPVHRVAIKLLIPPSDLILQKLNHCERSCLHGSCTHYMNKPGGFCRCYPGWSGSSCSIRHNCSCALNALCVGSINNRSICICPLSAYGPRCYLKQLSCATNPCQNDGFCVSNDKRIPKRTFICICPEGFSGDHCEVRQIRLDVTFSKDIEVPSFLYAHLLNEGNGIHLIKFIIFKKLAVFEISTTLFVLLGVQMVLLNFNNQLYLTAVLPRIFNAINISSRITPLQRCHHIRELFNATFIKLHLLRRLKKYHLPCQEQTKLLCFHDDVFICLCNLDRHANCFRYSKEKAYTSNVYCENGARYIYNEYVPTMCPTKSMWVCSDCFHGGRCQFSTKGASLSIDFILGYYIRPHISMNHQPTMVKVSIFLTMFLSVIGFVSAALSAVVSQDKIVRKVGCGRYLFGSSIISFLLVFTFLLRFWMLIFSQLSLITNRSLLHIHCLSVDAILNILLSTSNWFNAFINVERAVSVLKGVAFNKRVSRKIAKWSIVSLTLLTIVTYAHDPLNRRQVYDEEERRTWCVVQYSPLMQMVNAIITTCHFLIPCLINIISAFIIIHVVVLKRSNARQQPYKQQLGKELEQSKHLLISPVVLIILYLPHIVIKFLPGCMKSTRNSWFYFVTYFLPFIPPFSIFLIFVYPSTQYCETLKKTLQRCWRRVHLRLRIIER